jgi:hypothetical protein
VTGTTSWAASTREAAWATGAWETTRTTWATCTWSATGTVELHHDWVGDSLKLLLL